MIQGYGLTETTSLVSLNHPFRLGSGSIGKALPGLEVKLADDGEILVRGENVASGYWKDAGVASVLDADGWFHTGDLGERDASGNLYFKGRQKNVIVTPEGLNVYPAGSGGGAAQGAGRARLRGGGAGARRERGAVRGAAAARGAFRGCARPEIVQRANERLAPFQQMRRWLVWPDKDFPRTPTQKPVLSRIREAAEAELGGEQGGRRRVGGPSGPLAELFARVSHGRALPDD